MIGYRLHVKAQKWTFDQNNFQFPEWSATGFDITNKNFGLAFSGGGNRSAPLTAGYLRALDKTGVLAKAGYISSVSGGSWAAVPFTFLDASIPDSKFFGEYVRPEDLRMGDLNGNMPGRFTDAVSDSVIIDDLLGTLLSGDERFAKIINSIYLKPFLLGDRRRFFAYNKNHIVNILNRSGNQELNIYDFYHTRANRPYLIVNGMLSRSFGFKVRRYPFEMTPIYSGVPTHFPNEGSNSKHDIGGGYVESFAFDSDSPDTVNQDNTVDVRIKRKHNIFSLSDVIATSGAAPAEHLDRFGVDLGFPEFKYWSPLRPTKAKEYDFADGGLMDNSGILSLLRRGVTKIIAFVNGSADLGDEEDVSSMIEPLFNKVNSYLGMKDFDENVVFGPDDATSRSEYKQLVSEMIRLKRHGKPVVVEKRYTTRQNDHHGVKPGMQVKVCWVYNAFVNDWFEAIGDRKVKEYVEEEHKKRNFPNYRTFGANLPKLIDMDLPQVNALSQLGSYIVESSSAIKNF